MTGVPIELTSWACSSATILAGKAHGGVGARARRLEQLETVSSRADPGRGAPPVARVICSGSIPTVTTSGARARLRRRDMGFAEGGGASTSVALACARNGLLNIYRSGPEAAIMPVN